MLQRQEEDAVEMAEQIEELEGDRAHLQVVTQDLDLAEDRVSRRTSLHCLPMHLRSHAAAAVTCSHAEDKDHLLLEIERACGRCTCAECSSGA